MLQKNLFNKWLGIIILCFITVEVLQAQEKLWDNQGNLALQRIASQSSDSKSRLKASTVVDTLELPLIDDFSSTSVFPNSKYWADSGAYINSYMAKNILSIGVATLDNINARGGVYENASINPFRADYLTSQPINLGSFDASDSIYLSFLFEPCGNVDAPETGDSLILEFYAPKDSTWISVWDTCGFSSSVFSRMQMVPVTDSKYFHKGFRFRFCNIASIQTNDAPGKVGIQDTWHLDYVRLDKGRNINDTIIRDVAFTKPLASFLKTYQSMPWNHFQKAYVNELRRSTDVTFRNNDVIGRYVYSKIFRFKELNTANKDTFSIGGDSISSGISFKLEADFKNPFTSATEDTTVYNITSYLVTDNYDLKSNDTIHFQQIFGKYFAYDDGSPESGFGLSGEGTLNALYACQFNAFVEDTLRAIEIYFNPTFNNATQYYSFKLAVWADNKGIPGKMIYLSSEELNPDPTKMNRFNPYVLDTAVIVSDKFYIGWKQLDENFLNIGYDLNTDSRKFLFKNMTGTWSQPGNIIAPGSIMIRPSFRKYNKPVSIPDISKVSDIRIFPNPFQNTITLVNEDMVKIKEISIYSSIGQQVLLYTKPKFETFEVNHLKPGIYILKIVTEKGSVQTLKMIKEK
jgi:hypothetical protein